MSNIDWTQYEQEIIRLSEQGMSSRQIAEDLSGRFAEIKPTSDRSIRSVLQRLREDDKILIKQGPAKVLLFDIETSPMIAYNWNRKPNYLPEGMILEDWFVINWAAKWLFDDEMITSVVTPEEARNRDDKRVVKNLWKLLNEADVVIAHYGDMFDIKMMNGRFFKHNLNLPMPYRSIDTKKAASKRMRLPAFNLNYIARYMGLDQKHSTDFDLWVQCMAGNQEKLNEMDEYCQQDVRVLEDVYLKLRPFIQPHPNLGMYIETDTKTCPACGSEDLEIEGKYATTVNIYDAYRCQDCGSITRSRKSKIKNRDHVTSSVPR